jgi:hypothetical protein
MTGSKRVNTSSETSRRRVSVALGESLDDRLVGDAGAVEETRDIEAGVARANRSHAGGRRNGFGFRRWGRHAGHTANRRRQAVFRLTADTPAQHRIEVVEHEAGQGGQDEQFQDLHGESDSRPARSRRAPR